MKFRTLILVCALAIPFVSVQPVLGMDTYTLKAGDKLWDLNQKFYSDPTLYPFLLEVNSVDNPRTVGEGKVIIVPTFEQMRKIASEPDPAKRKILVDDVRKAGASSLKAATDRQAPPPSATKPTQDEKKDEDYIPIDPRKVSLKRILTVGPNCPPEKLKKVEALPQK